MRSMLYFVGGKGDGRLIEVKITNVVLCGGSEGYKKRKRVVICESVVCDGFHIFALCIHRVQYY